MTHPITGFFGRYRFLSNFHEQTVVLDGVEYPTNEHAFQAAKTLNPEEREIIRLAPKPADAKNLGGPKSKGGIVTLREDWELVKIGIMYDLNLQKFSKSPLKERLLSTDDAYLEETNTWKDIFWGVCNGVGQNWLGKILMQVREALRQ